MAEKLPLECPACHRPVDLAGEYAAGRSIMELSQMTSRCYGVVRRRLLSAGAKLRPPGARGR